jgi:ribosomal protein L11 methylase PrmA
MMIINDIVEAKPDLIIDVGCAEGYYAIGMARRLPNATIWARDANKDARSKCAHLAKLNGVTDRVEIGGIMTHADFDICQRHKSVVICDIEGGEKDLLDPHLAKGLFATDILVECHPTADSDMVGVLTRRFEKTHNIKQIDRELDTASLPKWMDGTSDLDRLLALWEWRSTPTPWLWMTAKPANQ